MCKREDELKIEITVGSKVHTCNYQNQILQAILTILLLQICIMETLCLPCIRCMYVMCILKYVFNEVTMKLHCVHISAQPTSIRVTRVLILIQLYIIYYCTSQLVNMLNTNT
jgi:hypothetical protein